MRPEQNPHSYVLQEVSFSWSAPSTRQVGVEVARRVGAPAEIAEDVGVDANTINQWKVTAPRLSRACAPVEVWLYLADERGPRLGCSDQPGQPVLGAFNVRLGTRRGSGRKPSKPERFMALMAVRTNGHLRATVLCHGLARSLLE